MRLITKMVFGAAALLTASAASFPTGLSERYFGSHPQDTHKREALKMCQQESRSFVSFLASDRDECYREMRPVGMTAGFSGVWSKPDRKHMQVAAD